MKQSIFLLLLILFLGEELVAQTIDTLTNKSVIKLKSAGLSNEIIKSTIQGAPCKFDISVDGLIILKKAGLTDDVINTMVTRNGISVTSPTTSKNPKTPTLSTSGDMTSGIYYCKGNPCTLTDVEASVYSQAKIGSGILTSLTYGIAKTKMKATLSGEKSQLQILETNPIFYFYFDKNTSGNLGTQSQFLFSNATSPNEFFLVKFTVAKQNREVVTGSVNSYAGMTSGIDDKCKVSFKFEKVSQGVYKVYTEQPLGKGEYAFMYAGSAAAYTATTQKVYDFGVQ